jgi:hypothetical protein
LAKAGLSRLPTMGSSSSSRICKGWDIQASLAGTIESGGLTGHRTGVRPRACGKIIG